MLAVVRPYVRGLIRKAMRERGVTYEELAVRLETYGIRTSENTLIQKVNRMEFSGHFLMVCLKALDVEAVDLRELDVIQTVRAKRLRVLG